MAYDLLIKNGRVVDGSGGPSFRADLAVKDGKIVEIGKLSGPAGRTIDAAGLVVAKKRPRIPCSRLGACASSIRSARCRRRIKHDCLPLSDLQDPALETAI